MVAQPPFALPAIPIRRTRPQSPARRPARPCRRRTPRRSGHGPSSAKTAFEKVQESLESIARRVETFGMAGAERPAPNVMTLRQAGLHLALRPARIPAKVSHGRCDMIPPQPLQSILRKDGEKHGRDT